MPIKDMTGQRFGRLVVLRQHPERSPSDRTVRWVCQCDCGNVAVRHGTTLRKGEAVSCNCRQREVGPETRIHGKSNTSIYNIWQGMLSRCEDLKDRSYPRYGGRGISVCERWHEFANFYADMGDKPSGKTLDRINNDGNYEPGNCRWATPAEQARNTRRNVFVEFAGRRMILTDWAREAGIAPSVLGGRLRKGWTIERALTAPINTRSSA
jgi:hypothetical protein